MNEKEICKELCSLGGTSGDENEAAQKAKQLLSKFMNVTTDTLGNVIGTLSECSKINILLEAHLDRVGLVVREIDENGFLHVEKVGGTDVRTLVGSEVIVYGKEKIYGVVCSTPPHLLTEADKAAGVDLSKIAVDIGCSAEKANELVSVSDRVVVTAGSSELLGERFTAPALDNRASIAAVLLAVSQIYDKLENVNLTVAFTTQEEVGGSGAKTAAFGLSPDYAICVDVGFGSDLVSEKEVTIDLGKGASIGISPVLDRGFVNELKAVAKKNAISYQHDVMTPRTGTNADSVCISKGGVRTALLSIPLRNLHTPVEVVDMEDIRLTAKLISSFILEKERNESA
ncbi:MAG: M20/M25/M40 family metallo-hydrolase [Acutalibacteraceae bacterium]